MELTKKINSDIFREYDLRGIANVDLTDDVAYTIGRSYGSYVKKDGNFKVVIGYDNRTTSPRLAESLIKGITESGVSVVDLGLVTTPMFYYAKIYYNIPTGIMITASHNPKEYNGFKMSFSSIGNAYGPLIQEFKDFTYNGDFETDELGQIVPADIKSAYLANLKKSIKLGDRQVKVVVDCGNGTGSIIIREALDLFNIKYDTIYCNSDPEFPNHVPDPAVGSNMIDLGQKVKELGYDFGIGIDGDTDRVGIVDENGEFITADLVMLIIYRSIVNTMHNKKALFDVKCSRTLIDGLKMLDIKPIMNRTGNSYCNLKMQGELDNPFDDFDFGGEYSGHLFFRDRYQGFDDGIYGALRIIEILSNSDGKFSSLLQGVNEYYSTEEIKIPVTEDNKFDIVEGVKSYVISKNYDFEDMDGIRVEFIDGWALIRASNTGPNLTVRFEAKKEKRLEEIKVEFMDIIEKEIKLHS